MSGFRHWLLWMLLLLGGVHADTQLPASPTPSYIRDDAKWLSPSAFQSLNENLKNYERETSSQFVVAIFPRIPEGAELFDFSQRLFEDWKPGQKGKDNGAIFLIFAEDRKMRIHTGRGMEGVLPDARCKQIIQDIVAPKLRAGNREAAITAGVDAMIAAANGEYQGTGTTQLDGRSGEKGIPWPFILILIIVIIKVVNFGRRVKYYSAGGWSYTGGSSWGGGSGGGFSGGGSSGGFSGGGGDSGGGGASGSW
ncbi:MAG: hypothetical protein CFE26_04970 [Verrucomicrobiales bacterium VVV1]|nr:MAG: hypothetical protein CFE26_04970 [Verrucomicrobiales bacterium VVV1]